MVELSIHGVAKGGDGVGREPDGRVVFVRGALPGDLVVADIVSERKRHAHAELREVLKPGPGRVEAPCTHLADGCGGCDLQHASLDRQRELKMEIVSDALERIGRFESPVLSFGGGVSGLAYRTSARCQVLDGRLGFHRARSNDVVTAPDCLIVHPAVQEVMRDGHFGDADEVSIRVGARTGERTVLVSPSAAGATVPAASAQLSTVLGTDDIDAGSELYLHEEVAGRRWRVSARSFFQSSPEAAELLVSTVADQLGVLDASQTLCDLYSGVGLFAGGLGHGGRCIAVEVSPSALADAAVNLADCDATVVSASVPRWHPDRSDVVVADPSRQGLGATAADVVAGTGAGVVALVSCDPAACARDARLLVERGYSFEGAVVLDLFPQTSHIEVVSRFVR